jgi:hypothetical protein
MRPTMSDTTTACPSLTRVSVGSRAYMSTVRLYNCHSCVDLLSATALVKLVNGSVNVS